MSQQKEQLSPVEALRPTDGWKLHLNFETDNPVISAQVENFLRVIQMQGSIQGFKIGDSGEQEGKAATVYVGAKKDALRAAMEIEKSVGQYLRLPAGNVLLHDCMFTKKVWGRFSPRADKSFHQYGSNGVPYLANDMNNAFWSSEKVSRAELEERANNVLTQRYGEFFTG